MKIEISINQKEIEQAVVEKIADKIWEKNSDRIRFGRTEVERTIYEKANKFIDKDKKFNDKIKREVNKQLNNKRLLSSVAKEIIKDKMEDRE